MGGSYTRHSKRERWAVRAHLLLLLPQSPHFSPLPPSLPPILPRISTPRINRYVELLLLYSPPPSSLHLIRFFRGVSTGWRLAGGFFSRSSFSETAGSFFFNYFCFFFWVILVNFMFLCRYAVEFWRKNVFFDVPMLTFFDIGFVCCCIYLWRLICCCV